jgi:hypothetical protein
MRVPLRNEDETECTLAEAVARRRLGENGDSSTVSRKKRDETETEVIFEFSFCEGASGAV